LIPSTDFYLNPAGFFESLQRYKTKDTFLTNALVQFAMNRMNPSDCRHITLKGVQNMMLANDSRPKPLLYQHMVRYFARQKLDKESINTVYSHAANPMITTRSYMLLEPLAISLDPYWLRQGIVRALSPEEEPFGVLLHDSGIVPSNTMVAIVNPETHTLCPSNVVGEIWVSSDSNAKTFYNLDDMAHAQRFEATIVGNDPNVKYMRTGDFGFLWNVRRRVDNRMMQQPMMEEGQCLYVLGPVSETIVRNGLMHFPVDVELSMERCHSAIPSGGR
jgi:acyl-CoA synthetase (AMP-forming)/AMP-acid ligase II